MRYVFPKSIFINQDRLIDSNNADFCFISSMESLFKGSHTTWATKRSVIAYDEIEDRICEE